MVTHRESLLKGAIKKLSTLVSKQDLLTVTATKFAMSSIVLSRCF